jgi:hypothetical protein
MRIAIGLVLLCAAFGGMASEPDGYENRSDRFADSCRKAIALSSGATDRNIRDAFHGAECFGYLKGFFDGYKLAEIRNSDSDSYCLPDNVTMSQVARLVVKTADEHPEMGHHERWRLIDYALRSTWPCGGSGT